MTACNPQIQDYGKLYSTLQSIKASNMELGNPEFEIVRNCTVINNFIKTRNLEV